MIICSQQPASIIKAMLLARLTGDIPCFKGEESGLGLFGLDAKQDADQENVSGLLGKLAAGEARCDWLEQAAGRELFRLIAANLRYNSSDRAALIFAAGEEALRHGPAYCLNGIGKVSRHFIARYRAVAHEVHRMLGFVRFHPAPDDTLVCQPKLFHQTADLVLAKFAPRYPKTRLVLIHNDQAFIRHNGKTAVGPAEYYRSFTLNDPFTATWEKYYQSQYIASRKNITLASRSIPKKYWDWLDEGRILRSEAQK